MDAIEIIKQHLSDRHAMQLATVASGKPWICTVYYLADEDFNLYWASLPSRRHSQEIANDPSVAAAIVCHSEKGKPVAGLQIEGTASLLDSPDAIRPIAELYAAKFDRDQAWVNDFSRLRTEHRLYRLRPDNYVLFDEVNFKANPRQTFTRQQLRGE